MRVLGEGGLQDATLQAQFMLPSRQWFLTVWQEVSIQPRQR